MKKLVLAVMLVMLLGGVCFAGLLESFPDVKQGVAMDLTKEGRGDVLSLTTVDVVNWKNKLSIGAGITSQWDNNDNINPAVTLNYKIGGLEQWGFNYPLAKFVNIDLGVFASRAFDQDEWQAGVQVNILKLKF